MIYTVKDNFIFGFHGCDESLCNQLVNGSLYLDYGNNAYDWLVKLDCYLINTLVAQEKAAGYEYYSIRGVLFEGNEFYKNAGFHEKNHIQISVINPNCIKDYFVVRSEDSSFPEA